jgi:hypothetical protein
MTIAIPRLGGKTMTTKAPGLGGLGVARLGWAVGYAETGAEPGGTERDDALAARNWSR